MSIQVTSAPWRDRSAYHYVEALDRSGFAWELLRRNHRYRREAAGVAPPQIDSGRIVRVRALPGRAPRWGLCFPGAA